MIRTMSFISDMGSAKLQITAGWKDPAKLLDRNELMKKLDQALVRFSMRVKLKAEQKYDIEELGQFLVGDKELKADKVAILDLQRGSGVELERPEGTLTPT